MRGTILALDNWLDPAHGTPGTAYLDPTDWQEFVQWLHADPARAANLLDGTWSVRLFLDLLNRHNGGSGHRTRELGRLGVHLDASKPRKSDEMYVAEVLRVYFDNDASARPQAELLALARRQSGNYPIGVVSQHRGYWRVPLVNTYFLDPSTLKGRSDLPAQFDFVRDLAIHRAVALAVAHRLDHPPYGDVFLAGIIALRDYVRQLTGLTQDGNNLMQVAFKQDGRHLRLNPLTDASAGGSQQNEQKGYREMYCGLMTGIRNPLVHEGSASTYAQARYPDKVALLKYLCLLSILCERADPPLPY